MAVITNYSTLTQAISDFLHRSDLASDLFTDYFIQGAQEKIEADIFEQNYGNGIQWQEAAMVPTTIQGGTVPIPSGYLAPKSFQVSDGSDDVFTLIFKAPAWIYDVYPIRQPEGLPAYIARDVMASCTFTGTITLDTYTMNVTAVASGVIQIGMIIAGTNVPSNATITGFVSGTNGGIGVYTVTPSPTSTVNGTITGGGELFIFGPYPDSSYTVQGVFYQSAPLLTSGGATTNWMVANFPTLLHAACMIKAGEFLLDDQIIARWSPTYEDRLQSMLQKDKAERFSGSTMQIELG